MEFCPKFLKLWRKKVPTDIFSNEVPTYIAVRISHQYFVGKNFRQLHGHRKLFRGNILSEVRWKGCCLEIPKKLFGQIFLTEWYYWIFLTEYAIEMFWPNFRQKCQTELFRQNFLTESFFVGNGLNFIYIFNFKDIYFYMGNSPK